MRRPEGKDQEDIGEFGGPKGTRRKFSVQKKVAEQAQIPDYEDHVMLKIGRGRRETEDSKGGKHKGARRLDRSFILLVRIGPRTVGWRAVRSASEALRGS